MPKRFRKTDICLKSKLDLYILSLVRNGQKPSKEGFSQFYVSDEMIEHQANMYKLDIQMGMIDGKEISFVEKEIARLKDNFKLLFSEIERDNKKNS